VALLSKRRNKFDLKWIYKIKSKENGTIDRYKARVVAKGYSQVEEIDNFETFSLVVKMVSVRIVLAFVATHNLKVHQMDVKMTFFHGDLYE
jgi:hypothetical protein